MDWKSAEKGATFWVRFFLFLAENFLFLALVRKSCRPAIFFDFHRGGVFGARQKQREGARAVWVLPNKSLPPSLSAVPLLRGRRGEDLYGFSFTLSNDCLVVFLRCVEEVNAPI